MQKDIYETTGIVSEIQRFSVHDGPGIRTLVFLKGCPLRCKWCCNPENLIKHPQELLEDGEVKTYGREMAVEEVMREVRKDQIYYRRSQGGVTLSGGEALMQPDFVLALLMACKSEGINTAVETCSYYSAEIIDAIEPYLDYALCDLKHVDPDKHLEFTGVDNSLILDNIRRYSKKGIKLFIRVPVIPTFNESEKEIKQIALYVSTIRNVEKIHLLPYHNFGEGKYRSLGIKYEFSGIKKPSSEAMARYCEIVKEVGLDCQIGG